MSCIISKFVEIFLTINENARIRAEKFLPDTKLNHQELKSKMISVKHNADDEHWDHMIPKELQEITENRGHLSNT